VTLQLFLYLLAAILAALATFGVSLPRCHFGWAAVTLVIVATFIIPAVH
jgi:hypothetical protein